MIGTAAASLVPAAVSSFHVEPPPSEKPSAPTFASLTPGRSRSQESAAALSASSREPTSVDCRPTLRGPGVERQRDVAVGGEILLGDRVHRPAVATKPVQEEHRGQPPAGGEPSGT